MNLLHDKAIELLARREHSQQELKQKLLQRGFLLDEIECAINHLAESGLQSDQRFMETYVNKRVAAGYGPKQIAAELRQRGILDLPEIIKDESNIYWQDLLKRVWQKKFASLPNTPKEYAKQMNFLLYRGFNAYPIQKLLQNEND